MTVIFAAALRDCAVIGADSKRVDLSTGQAWSIDKSVRVSGSVAAAKFGYGGPEADRIWDLLSAQPPSVLDDVVQILGVARDLGQPIYDERRQFFADRGIDDYANMTLLFASYDVARGAGIHWLDFAAGGEPVSRWRAQGNAIVAQGHPRSQQLAASAAQANLITLGGDQCLKVASWSADLVEQVSQVDPQTVGPPARYRIVDALGVSPTRTVETALSFADMRPI